MTDETTQAQDVTAPAEQRPRNENIDPKLLEVLVCPVTRGPLKYDRAAQELISKRAALAFPIRNGIPIMLRDEARKLED